jgi:hypothetical protein
MERFWGSPQHGCSDANLTVMQYRVLSYEDLTNSHSDLAVALKFAPKVFKATTGLKICMAISAFGNIVAVTYTAAKGKSIVSVEDHRAEAPQ